MPRPIAAIRSVALSVMVLLVTLAAPVGAQQFSGTLRGTVLDSTGGILPGAEIAIVHIETNETHTVLADSNGSYIAPQLKPGLYRITVTMNGFKTAAINEVKVDVQQTRNVDITLQVGQAAELVTVLGTGGTIERTSSTISQTIENKRLVDLPLNGRNPFSLATLVPGVAPAPGSSPFISGGRNATSEVTIDGVSNVNAENNVSILDLNYTPSVDAVQEFSVQTNSVSAEFGRLGGGVINLVTKSGTNTFRATGFGFMRNSKFDATNFFTNRAGQKKGEFKRNQFGGNVGGPVVAPGLQGREPHLLLRQLREVAAGKRLGLDADGTAAGVAHRRLLEPAQREWSADRHLRSSDDAGRPGQPRPVHPRALPGQSDPGQPDEPGRQSAGHVLAAGQHHSHQRLHPGGQLHRLRRAAE